MDEVFRTDQFLSAERAEVWQHTLSTAFVPFEAPVTTHSRTAAAITAPASPRCASPTGCSLTG